MVMKLYYGGFGDYNEFVVAENEEQAILKVGIKINAPFLPIKVTEIVEVDGYIVQIANSEIKAEIANTTFAEKPIEAEEVEISQIETEIKAEVILRHCKKCDFVCDNQGVLMKHYATEHPKGD